MFVISSNSPSHALEKVCGFLWPATLLRRAKRETDEELKARYLNLVNSWVVRAKQETDAEFFVEEANRLYSLELDRKRDVETKGSALIGVAGLALTLTSIGLTLVGKEFATVDWTLKVPILTIICVAIIYFIGSGYYAVRATQILPFWTATTYGFAAIPQGPESKIEWGARKLAQTEMNYDVTRMRTNYLSASQSMLLRGLVVLGAGALVLFSVLLAFPTPSSNSTFIRH